MTGAAVRIKVDRVAEKWMWGLIIYPPDLFTFHVVLAPVLITQENASSRCKKYDKVQLH